MIESSSNPLPSVVSPSKLLWALHQKQPWDSSNWGPKQNKTKRNHGSQMFAFFKKISSLQNGRVTLLSNNNHTKCKHKPKKWLHAKRKVNILRLTLRSACGSKLPSMPVVWQRQTNATWEPSLGHKQTKWVFNNTPPRALSVQVSGTFSNYKHSQTSMRLYVCPVSQWLAEQLKPQEMWNAAGWQKSFQCGSGFSVMAG